VKIAVVGAGVSGLVAARVLDSRHEVSVFEAEPRLGGHANTVEVCVGGKRLAVDTGFIVYNERTYPAFTRLLADLGVETQPSDMSLSICDERSQLEWSSRSLGAIFAQRRNILRPAFHGLLREILRFNRESHALLAEADEKVAIGDYLYGAGYSDAFVNGYIVPMGAAIWSAVPEDFLRFPALTLVRFFANHGLLDHRGGLRWRTIRGGSRRYVSALAAGLRRPVRTGCAVRQLRRLRGGAELRLADGRKERFDRVILAVHSDQALALLADPSESERQLLGAIRYQPNEAILHTDASCMPRLRRAWASWNYRIPSELRNRVFVTYHMNRLQRLPTDQDLFVTLNAADRIDPGCVIRRFPYHHPVFDADAIRAQRLHFAIDGQRATHYCGAYWGFGFHEDGVRSALAVCRKLGREL